MYPNNFEQIRKAFIEDVFGHNIMSERFKIIAEIDFLEESDAMVENDASRVLPTAMPFPEASLEELLNTAKESITLGAYLRQKANLRDMVTFRPALFEHGQISRDYWSRLLNDEMKASKEKLLRVAILLKLSEEEAEEMLDKAGFSMSPTIPRDVVVQYCLRNEHYDFVLIEQLLADHEIQSLFNDRRGA